MNCSLPKVQWCLLCAHQHVREQAEEQLLLQLFICNCFALGNVVQIEYHLDCFCGRRFKLVTASSFDSYSICLLQFMQITTHLYGQGYRKIIVCNLKKKKMLKLTSRIKRRKENHCFVLTFTCIPLMVPLRCACNTYLYLVCVSCHV